MSRILIAGPCAHEHSVQWLVDQAGKISDQLFNQTFYDWVFKCSFDKANRTIAGSYRGLGLDKTLEAFRQIKKEFGCQVTTDVHEVWQIAELGDTVDIIQIPAMLSRQTDLIEAAAETSATVNIKVGKDMGVKQAAHAVEKVTLMRSEPDVMLTYRGTAFGNELIFDPARLVELNQWAPVIADVTHSAAPGKQRINARVAATLDVDGIFLECHSDPPNAKSDAMYQITTSRLRDFLEGIEWAS